MSVITTYPCLHAGGSANGVVRARNAVTLVTDVEVAVVKFDIMVIE